MNLFSHEPVALRGLRTSRHMSPYIAQIKMLFQLLPFLKLFSGQLLPSAHLGKRKSPKEEREGKREEKDRGMEDVVEEDSVLCRFHGD